MRVVQHPFDIPVWHPTACLDKHLAPSSEHATVPGIQSAFSIVRKTPEAMSIRSIEMHCHAEAETHGSPEFT